MINYFYIVALILSMLCCSFDSKNRGNVMHKESSISSTKLIVREWSCCKKRNKGYEINYNICPKFIFKENNVGYYVKPSAEQVEFGWELLNDSTLNINLIKEENEPFKQGTYKMIFTANSNYLDLQLRHVDTDLIYFMGANLPADN